MNQAIVEDLVTATWDFGRNEAADNDIPDELRTHPSEDQRDLKVSPACLIFARLDNSIIPQVSLVSRFDGGMHMIVRHDES